MIKAATHISVSLGGIEYNMTKRILFFLIIFSSVLSFSQEKVELTVDKPAQAVGGQKDIDYVFQSQVIYPDALLKKKVAADVAIYFVVAADGSVKNIEFKQEYKEEFKTEAKRLLRYFLFTPATIGNIAVASQSFLVFKFDPETYKKFTKSRGFVVHKEQALFDTSFVIHTRADSSPEYFKGDDALGEFILSNLEYPDLAIRQNLQGTVVMNFVVEPNGTISNIAVEKEFNHFCTEEALRIMRQTKWKAGKKDGKLIRYRTKYPIVFNLNNINKDNATSEQR
jgi:TonB family protein